MTDPILNRNKVREMLAWAPTRRFSDELLLANIDRLGLEKPTVMELHQALEWNKGKGFIEAFYNGKQDFYEWQITPAGLREEGL